MSLIDLVTEKIVKIPLESKDKPDVLRELVRILKANRAPDCRTASLSLIAKPLRLPA